LNEESTPCSEEVVVVDVASSPPLVTLVTEPTELDEDSTSYQEGTLPSPSVPIFDNVDDDDVFVFDGPGPTTRGDAPSTTNAFIEQYKESLQPVTRLIEHQISRATWCGTNFKVHPPAADERINDISAELRRICPAVLQLSSINRSNINNYRELDEVMRCHSRSSAYLVQYYKQPLVAPCNCPACRLCLWSPFTLDKELAGSLPHAWQVIMPSVLVYYMLLRDLLSIHIVFVIFISSLT
jgi:hypothetical protein